MILGDCISAFGKLLPDNTNDGTDSGKQQPAQQKNRQVDAAIQEASTNCKNSAEKYRMTIGVQRAEVNQRQTAEKVETEIQQKSEIILSAEKSLIAIGQNVQSPKIRQISARAKEITGRQKKMTSAKEIIRRQKKMEGQAPKATTTTPTASEDDVTVKTAQPSQHHDDATF